MSHALLNDPARTTLTLASFLDLFADVETESRGWAVTCTAHADTRPSLAVAYNAEAKKIALQCRAGCKTEDVLDSLGLTMSALFDVEPGDLGADVLRTVSPGTAEPSTGERAALALYLDRTRSALEDNGSEAFRYLADRFGISPESALEIGLGYDDGTVDGGKLILSRSRYKDTARLVVPLLNFEGHPHGLQARALAENAAVRWSNPNGSSWGRYGVLRSNEDRPEFIVTEGPSDGLTAVAAGYDAVFIRGAALASSGVLADRIAAGVRGRPVVVAGDADTAGAKFAADVTSALVTRGIDARRLTIPVDGVNDLAAWREAIGENFPVALADAVATAPPVEGVGEGTGGGPSGRRERDYDLYSVEDAHLGPRIAEDFLRGRWCWAVGFGWLRWDGRRWEKSDEVAALEAVRRALLSAHDADVAKADRRLAERRAEAEKERDEAIAQLPAEESSQEITEAYQAAVDVAEDERGKRLKSLRLYFRLGTINTVMRLAKSRLREDGGTFDAEPYLLNVGNGVVDLRTGVLGPHRPELRFTKVTEVRYVPGATSSDWATALEAMTPEVRNWMHLRFGQSATGFPPNDDVVPFLYGGGNNGKSSVIVGVLQALGDFAIVVPEKVLLPSPGDHTTELTTLQGARLAILEELPQGRWLDAKRLKSIAGTDKITARPIAQDNVTWQASHSLLITTNYELRVDENDHGTWRRLARVPFPFTYGEGPGKLPAVPGLRQNIRDGVDGVHEAVLAWIVDGAVRLHTDHGGILPKPPDDVAKSTRAWRGTTDVLGRFLDEVAEVDENSAVLSKEFYEVFQRWCETYGHRAWGDQLLWERLRSHEVATSGPVRKPDGPTRLGAGRRFSTVTGKARPKSTARLVLGLRFTDEARSIAY